MAFHSDGKPHPEPGSENGPHSRGEPPSPDPPPLGGVWFADTSWTLVLHAPFCPETLRAVITRYEPAARAWCRAKLGDQGDEVFHGFVEKLLHNPNPLGMVRQEKGRFRDWLKKSLTNEFHSIHRRNGRIKRGGGQPSETLDSGGQDHMADPAAADPAEEFDRRYAARLMELVTERFFSGLKEDSVEAAIARIMFGADEATVRRFCEDHGITTRRFYDGKIRLGGQFQALLREEVAASLCDPDGEKIYREIEELKSILRNTRS